jgi:hypothetical protein
MDIKAALIALNVEKEAAYRSYREAYDVAIKKYNEELCKLLPFKDKFVKIKTYIDNVIYLRVDELFKHKSINNSDDVIILRGYGFTYEFTAYADATYAHWDFFQSYEINLSHSDLNTIINDIHIIDKDEFNKAFEEMINNITKEHKNTLK